METPNSRHYVYMDNILSFILNKKPKPNNNKNIILTATDFPYDGSENTSVHYFVNLP